MPNRNRNKKNQRPTGEGKKQSPRRGAEVKLDKRSEVLQASQRRQNIGTVEDEEAVVVSNPKRPKAGR